MRAASSANTIAPRARRSMVPSARPRRRRSLDHGPEALRPRTVDLVADLVGVDDVRAELGEDRRHGALARADAAGQPDDGKRSRHAEPSLA
jgi:hypothetical protein